MSTPATATSASRGSDVTSVALTRVRPRGPAWLSAVEFLAGAAIVIAHNVYQVIPNEVFILFVLGWISIRLRDGGWKNVGLARPKSWPVAVGIALAYGAAAWWAVYKGRLEFDEPLRPLQTRLAIGLCGLALFLALPIVDFGAISANSQLARLESGKLKAEEFDWTAMAFDFGKAGRRHLQQIERSGPANHRLLAAAALKSENRYVLSEQTESVAQQARLDQYLRLLSPDIELTDALKSDVTGSNGCNDRPCALLRLDAGRLLLVYKPYDGSFVQSRVIALASLGSKVQPARAVPAGPEKTDLARATIEIRSVQRRQLYVDGRPVGEVFE